MSHQNTAPWPTLPAPRTQAEADEFYADGGASPSRAEDWPQIEAMITAHPNGCPLPVGWSADDPGFRLRMDIYQSGNLGLFSDRTVRVGEGDEAGKTWGESVQISLPIEGELADIIASAEVRTWTSGYTAAEIAERDRRTGVLRRIQIWANSREAATIPWGGMNEGGRRDIADCLDAIDAVAEHPRRGEWIATVKTALHIYPVARTGLERCIRDLGQAEVFGLAATASTPLFILGAADAEMTAIESLLRECGQDYAYAACTARRYDATLGRMVPVLDTAGEPVRQRVPPGTRADVGLLIWPEDRLEQVPSPGREVIAIEVAGPWGQPAIDHHDEAERASWGPDRFLQASSLGQVIERLAPMSALPDSWAADHVCFHDGIAYHGEVGTYAVGPTDTERIWVIPQALVFEGAADHCPAAAIKGLCPGVDPGSFAPFLAESKRRQYFPAMSSEDFARELEISRATLLAAPEVAGLPFVRDLRHLEPGTVPAQDSGECYPAEFLVGIVAALFEGLGFVCRIRRRDGRLALRSNGHGLGTAAGTRPAEVFLTDPAAFGCGPTSPPGQDASYGNPVRGFFGGTLINPEL